MPVLRLSPQTAKKNRKPVQRLYVIITPILKIPKQKCYSRLQTKFRPNATSQPNQTSTRTGKTKTFQKNT